MESFVGNVVRGFREGKASVGLPDIPEFSKDDVKEYQPGNTGYPDERTELEPVRAAEGVLDFLTHVVEEVSEWIERETGEGHVTRPRVKPGVLATRDVPAASYSVRRVPVTSASTPGVHAREDRRYLRIVNHGPDTAYFSADTVPVFDPAAVPPNVGTIPASVLGGYFPVEMATTDEMWFTCAVGDTAVVEVMDVYGVPD